LALVDRVNARRQAAGVSVAGPLEQCRLDCLTPARSCGLQRRLSRSPRQVAIGDPSGKRSHAARTGVRRCDRPADRDARRFQARRSRRRPHGLRYALSQRAFNPGTRQPMQA